MNFEKMIIPYDPNLNSIIGIGSHKYGLVIAHGERSFIDEGIINSLAKKLAEKQISSLRFNFPFRENQTKADSDEILDKAYIHVWNWVNEKYPNIKWVLAGHDIGAVSAIRISILASEIGEIPAIICLGYPMYPVNRPELVDTRSFGAIMGDALFIQGDKDTRGSYDRLANQIQMMATHCITNKIKGANHDFQVEGKNFDRVAFWISNDIENFLKNIS